MRLKIGISVPLSVASELDSDVRSVGHDVLHAFLFAQKTHHSNHELIILDNQNQKERLIEIARTFEQEKVDAIFGVPTSDEVHVTAQTISNRSIPIITSMATSPKLATYENVFRTRPSDIGACKTMLKHLEQLGYRKLSTISEDTHYAKDCCQHLSKLGTANGIEFNNQVIKTHDRNVEKIVSEQLQLKPQAIFVASQDEEGFYCILKAIKNLDPEIPILGSAMPGSRKFRQMAGELATGITYVSEPELESTLNPQSKRYIKDFESEYGPAETGNYAILLTHAAFAALHAAGNSSLPLVKALSTLEIEDKLNGNFKFNEREITGIANSNFADFQLKIL